MALSRVEITNEVYLTCLSHALTTEVEEVMGLLLGDCKEDGSGTLVSRIWMAYPQIRTDRRKDRVESSPEQMARCCAHAERLSRETGVPTRVVGWYHSHPHITVLPSHVDVRTQAMYQMLDPGFVGLIFSVFNSDPVSKTSQIQLTAFQSEPAAGGGGALQSPMASGDFAGMDDALKAAIKASTASAQASSPDAMVRKEVPLVVAPGATPTERSLHDYSVLHRVLDKEEKEAYTAAMKAAQSSSSDPGAPPTLSACLARMHHTACYQQGLANLLEGCIVPALRGMECLLSQQAVQEQQLRARNAALKEQLIRKRERKQQEEQQAALKRQQQQQQSKPPLSVEVYPPTLLSTAEPHHPMRACSGCSHSSSFSIDPYLSDPLQYQHVAHIQRQYSPTYSNSSAPSPTNEGDAAPRLTQSDTYSKNSPLGTPPGAAPPMPRAASTSRFATAPTLPQEQHAHTQAGHTSGQPIPRESSVPYTIPITTHPTSHSSPHPSLAPKQPTCPSAATAHLNPPAAFARTSVPVTGSNFPPTASDAASSAFKRASMPASTPQGPHTTHATAAGPYPQQSMMFPYGYSSNGSNPASIGSIPLFAGHPAPASAAAAAPTLTRGPAAALQPSYGSAASHKQAASASAAGSAAPAAGLIHTRAFPLDEDHNSHHNQLYPQQQQHGRQAPGQEVQQSPPPDLL